jgi:uncharacterized protein
MNLEEKSLEVRQIFEELEVATKVFLEASNLGCLSGCGRCCANPKVSASVLEFIPLAFDLYEKGIAEQALTKLQETSENDFCIIYKSMSPDGAKGMCSDYKNRGMICRLFGSSARKNKSGNKEIITCKPIKMEKKEAFEAASAGIENMVIPGSSDYYTRLYNVDFDLTSEQFPINTAILKALEAVLTFKYYSEISEKE